MCYKLAFNSDIFSYNYGHYLNIIYFSLYFISFCISLKKGLTPIISNIPQGLLEFHDDLKNVLQSQKTKKIEKILNLNSENDSFDNGNKARTRKRNSTRKKSRKKSKRKTSNEKMNQDNSENFDAPPKKKSIPRLTHRKSSINTFVITDKVDKHKEEELVDKIKFSRKSTFRKRQTGITINDEKNKQIDKI